MKITISNNLKGAEGMVCAPKTDPLYFADNVVGQCSKCGAEVQHRKNAPRHLPLVCVVCFATWANEDTEMITTPLSVIEARNWFRRN